MPLKAMPLISSENFTSVCVSGNDWRDVCKKALSLLEPEIKKSKGGYTLGFMYLSDSLQEDAESILNLFKSVTGIESWSGCVGVGVCGSGCAFLDEPSISVLLAKIDPAQFFALSPEILSGSRREDPVYAWFNEHETMLSVLHANPDYLADVLGTIEIIENATSGFVVGGLASSREKHILFSSNAAQGAYSGVVFDAGLDVATTITQGVSPLGPSHVITRCEGDVIIELDNQRALEVMRNDLKNLFAGDCGWNGDPSDLKEIAEAYPDLSSEDYEKLVNSGVHIAFPVTVSDSNEMLVRNITDAEIGSGRLRVSQTVHSGQRVTFVNRTRETLRIDLARELLSLRQRVTDRQKEFAPKGALYISCLARTHMPGNQKPVEEMNLIKEIIGDIPLAGFYASGEISAGRLYQYAGVLVLFL